MSNLRLEGDMRRPVNVAWWNAPVLLVALMAFGCRTAGKHVQTRHHIATQAPLTHREPETHGGER
jgi:hypothetical protein